MPGPSGKSFPEVIDLAPKAALQPPPWRLGSTERSGEGAPAFRRSEEGCLWLFRAPSIHVRSSSATSG